MRTHCPLERLTALSPRHGLLRSDWSTSGNTAGARPALVRRTRSTLDNHDVEYGDDLVDQLVEVAATVLHQRGQLHDQRGATRHD